MIGAEGRGGFVVDADVLASANENTALLPTLERIAEICGQTKSDFNKGEKTSARSYRYAAYEGCLENFELTQLRLHRDPWQSWPYYAKCVHKPC